MIIIIIRSLLFVLKCSAFSGQHLLDKPNFLSHGPKLQATLLHTHTSQCESPRVFLIIDCIVSYRWRKDFYKSPRHLSQCSFFTFFISQRTRQCFPPGEWFITHRCVLAVAGWWVEKQRESGERGCIYSLWPHPPSSEFFLLITSPIVIMRSEPPRRPTRPQRSTDSQ